MYSDHVNHISSHYRNASLHMDQNSEILIEIYSKTLIRAIHKVKLMEMGVVFHVITIMKCHLHELNSVPFNHITCKHQKIFTST